MRLIYNTHIVIALLVNSFLLSGQEIQTLEPKIGKTYDFSQERQEQWKTCDSLVYSKYFKEEFTQEEIN